MSDSNTFCPAPFVHFYHKGSPLGKVCCIANNKIMHKNTAKVTWEDSRLTQIRNDLLEGKAVDDCKPCYAEEERGGISDRQYYIKHYSDNYDFDKTFGTKEFTKPVDLDLRLSNLCNLACRMCGPHYSSMLAKEAHKLPDLNETPDFNETPNGMITDADIDYLITDNPDLRRIKFLGGEPTVMPEVYKILDILLEKDRQIKLGITTNCTNVNKKFEKYLEHFKNVTINMSIDATGETLEYIRHPVNSKIVDKNSQILCKMATTVNVNCVIQALNMHDLSNFVDFVVTRGGNMEDVNSVICEFPRGTSPFYLPIKYRREQCEKVLDNKNINELPFKKVFKPQVERVYASEEIMDPQPFMIRNMAFDESRGTHLYKIMPDIKPYLVDVINNIGKSSKKKPRLVKHYVDKEI